MLSLLTQAGLPSTGDSAFFLERRSKMKSTYSILTIILVVFLVGMVPNLADAKTIKTITIRPENFVPLSGADNYYMSPLYVSTTDGTFCTYWAKINFPKNAKHINKLTYYHLAWGGSITVYIYRCKVGEDIEFVGQIWSNDDTSTLIKVETDILPKHKVNKKWTYLLYLSISSNQAQFRGAQIDFSTK